MEMTNFTVVREVLRNNYWSCNLIGLYRFWVISPGNLTSFTRLFPPGGTHWGGTRLGQTTSTKHRWWQPHLEWFHGSHAHQMKPSLCPTNWIVVHNSNVTHRISIPHIHKHCSSTHACNNSGLATSLKRPTSIVSCQKYKQHSLNRWAYVQDTL